MIKLHEPIYKVSVKKNLSDLVQATQKFIENNNFNIKLSSPDKLVIDSTIPIKLVFQSGWIKEIVFEFEQIGNNYSKLYVYGNYALSPHHLFFELRYRKKKINKQHFIYDLREYFEGHCLPKAQ